jgi:inhibitor of KinA
VLLNVSFLLSSAKKKRFGSAPRILSFTIGIVTWHRYGPNSLLIEFADKPGEWALQKCRGIVAELEEKPPVGLMDFAPGYINILLEFQPSVARDFEKIAREVIPQLEAASKKKLPPGPIREIPVKYNGPDLDRVAKRNKITIQQVIKYHTGVTYAVYLLGFSPGFPYLGDLHHRLRTPRLSVPRPKIAAGSVGIGGEQTGIYTVDSPGGWNIIGHTEVKLFEIEKALPQAEEGAFFLRQGDRVRLVAV